MNKFLVLPTSGDTNRGDQALVWETKDIAIDAGFEGEYNLLTENPSNMKQSLEEGFKLNSPILRHPSRKFNIKDNTTYNFLLYITWGTVALFDFLFSLSLLFKPTRKIAYLFMGHEQKKTLDLFEEVDAVFVKGGGFIHSYGDMADLYIVYYQLFHIILAQKLNKKVFVMPNSFGPFNALGVKPLVKYTLNRCELVTVRESISLKSLSEIGVTAELYPDIAFGLDKSGQHISEISKIRDKYVGYKIVAITARPYRFPSSENPEEDYKKYIDSFIQLSKWLYKNNFLPVFVEQTYSKTLNESDISAINSITSQLQSNQYEIIADKKFSSRDLKQIYSQADFTIGTRFHSVIFSISENVPSLAVTYGGNKGQGIMKDIDLSDFAVEMKNLDSNDLIERFKSLSSKEEEIRKELPTINSSIESELNKLAMQIKDIYNNELSQISEF